MSMRVAVLVLLSLSGIAQAAEPAWETIIDGPPITVKNRVREGSDVKEIWGEGDLQASSVDLQAALLDHQNFHKYMPSVQSTAVIGSPEADGSFYMYTQLDLPMLTSRDYAVQIWNDETVKPDGTGQFRQRWKAAPDKVPEKEGYIRVKVNDGSWQITPIGDGTKSRVVYKFATDPGGMIPGWAKNMGNKKAVVDVMKAVEAEAQRRGAERTQKQQGLGSK